jgi:uncharacterized membrane protein YqiK
MNGLLIALVVVAVLVLGGLALSVRIVQQYERGVLVRLGRVVGGSESPAWASMASTSVSMRRSMPLARCASGVRATSCSPLGMSPASQ